jgi:non-lysosomal glucosylceramidase
MRSAKRKFASSQSTSTMLIRCLAPYLLTCAGFIGCSSYAQAKPASDALIQLEFKNSGIVNRDMRFAYLDQPVEYAEDPDYWNVTRRAKYLYQLKGSKAIEPPSGMRSAVPLGGLGSGTVELRGDGSFRDWNIFNNSPAAGNKTNIDDTFFALRVKQKGSPAKSWALRTDPPRGLPAVGEIEYSGAFPVSRLQYKDPQLPILVTLYAYSEFYPRDAAASGTPAAIFTFELSNPSSHSTTATLLLNLQNFTQGHLSSDGGVTFIKDGDLPTSGTIAVRADANGKVVSSSDLQMLWKDFSEDRPRPAMSSTAIPKYASLAITTTIPPKQEREVTFVLAWFLPKRYFKDQMPGNYYTRLYSDAGDVATKVLSRIPDTQKAILAWQKLIFDNSLPTWLQDGLINSVATMYKTGLRFEDGRWRQWESFSCAGLDPVHIDFYRSLPYAFFFPELQKQLIRTHAQFQLSDGFIHEQLTTGCFSADSELDQPGGREMGDSATGFIMEVWQLYCWTGEKSFLDSMWPHIKQAAAWQIHRSDAFGLPQKLENTYDWWRFGEKNLVSYNAFLHLCAMLAAEKIANAESDSDRAQEYRTAFQVGQDSLKKHLWTGTYFRSWWLDGEQYPDALHADTLYGQLWAFILDLGLLTDASQLQSHLTNEAQRNGSAFGLKVMRGANPSHPDLENLVPRPGLSEPSPPDNMIWQAASLDWTSLSLYLGNDPNSSLTEAEKIVSNWRDRMRDQWDYTDTTNAWNGDLWCNSHYARQLIFWAIPLALSGQHYYAPEATLTFDPKIPAPAKLPFFTPSAAGALELLGQEKYRLTIISGNLSVKTLRVDHIVVKNPVSLRSGDSVVVAQE